MFDMYGDGYNSPDSGNIDESFLGAMDFSATEAGFVEAGEVDEPYADGVLDGLPVEEATVADGDADQSIALW